jgi:hypothetical protein
VTDVSEQRTYLIFKGIGVNWEGEMANATPQYFFSLIFFFGYGLKRDK